MRHAKMLLVALVAMVAATCGRDSRSPTAPSLIGALTFGAFDTDGAAAPRILSLDLSPSVFKGGDASHGTVTLDRPAPSGGVAIALLTDDTAAQVPASIAIAEGATTGRFSVSTREVAADVRILVTATTGESSLAAWIRLTPRSAVSLSSDAVRIAGGDSVTGTVTLGSPAPDGGTVVQLSSEGADARVPSTVTVARAARTATFAIETADVSNDTEVWLHATVGSDTASLQIRVIPRTSGATGSGLVTIGGVVR